MNSNLSKALSASILALGCAQTLFAQVAGPGYDGFCINANTSPMYSTDWNAYFQSTTLFGAGLGVAGTTNGWRCNDTNTVSVSIRGRFGFCIGSTGSVQDDLLGGSVLDNYMTLTYGFTSPENRGTRAGVLYTPSGSGWSYARLIVADSTGATTSSLYGANAMRLAYYGASNRYMLAETVNGTVDITLVIEVLADTAKMTWQLNNLGTTSANLGLWLGQYPQLEDQNGNILGYQPSQTSSSGLWTQPYVYMTGKQPLITQERWTRATDPANFPQTVNFMANQQDAYGLQVLNGPTVNTSDSDGNSDATAVDEFVVGDIDNVLAGYGGAIGDPGFADNPIPDSTFDDIGCYIQKWQPVPVDSGATRKIVAYYRSTWGDSNYSNGYSVVGDSPKVISTDSTDPTTFTVGTDANPATLRVHIDNTGAFGTVYKLVQMSSVRVTLNLPAGFHVPNNPNQHKIVKYISSIEPLAMAHTDFQFAVNGDVVGDQTYSVLVEPTPGVAKTITGTISVGAQPRLQVFQGANLVTSPWVFTTQDWGTVLGLVPDRDFQALTYDTQTAQYVIQTGPQSGIGSWVISNNDLGSVQLAGGPSLPSYQFLPSSGAPGKVAIYPGWNLVGNPYNYAIPVDQILVVPDNYSGVPLSWNDTAQTYVDTALTYYDATSHGYFVAQGSPVMLQPNVGYWVYATNKAVLQIPPVFQPFARTAAAPTFRQSSRSWKLQLSVKNAKASDTQNYVGVLATANNTVNQMVRKAPLDPTPNALRASITDTATSTVEYAQAIRGAVGVQKWNLNLLSKSGGTTTVTWPNLSTLPKNLRVQITDPVTKKTIDARSTASYSVNLASRATRSLQVTVTPLGTAAERIGTTSIKTTGTGVNRLVSATYAVTANGASTVKVLQNGLEVYRIVTDRQDTPGTKSVTWKAQVGNGIAATAGRYILDITTEGEGGDIAHKQVSFVLPK